MLISAEFEDILKVELSKIIAQIPDKSTEGLIREIIFAGNTDWEDVYIALKKHKPETKF